MTPRFLAPMTYLACIAFFACGGTRFETDDEAGAVERQAETSDASESFGACRVLTTDDAGLASGYADYKCGDEAVVFLRWDWDPSIHDFHGACPSGPFDAGCALGSPCVVDLVDGAYTQGGCL